MTASPVASVGVSAASGQRADAVSGGPSFKDVLLDAIRQMNAVEQDAKGAVDALATRVEINPDAVFTAVQKTDLAFNMMMTIRNELVQAYQELQSIRV
jgi:flagellar hook-basal body complex protein FliE